MRSYYIVQAESSRAPTVHERQPRQARSAEALRERPAGLRAVTPQARPRRSAPLTPRSVLLYQTRRGDGPWRPRRHALREMVRGPRRPDATATRRASTRHHRLAVTDARAPGRPRSFRAAPRLALDGRRARGRAPAADGPDPQTSLPSHLPSRGGRKRMTQPQHAPAVIDRAPPSTPRRVLSKQRRLEGRVRAARHVIRRAGAYAASREQVDRGAPRFLPRAPRRRRFIWRSCTAGIRVYSSAGDTPGQTGRSASRARERCEIIHQSPNPRETTVWTTPSRRRCTQYSKCRPASSSARRPAKSPARGTIA